MAQWSLRFHSLFYFIFYNLVHLFLIIFERPTNSSLECRAPSMAFYLKFFISFFCLILLITGCNNNPTASRDLTWITGDGTDGLEKLQEVSNIILLSPLIIPNIKTNPRILITGLNSKDRVYIYKDAQCSSLLTHENSNDTKLELTLPTLPIGNHTLYAKRRWELNNIESDCSSVFLNYEVRNPAHTGPQIDSVESPAIGAYRFNQNLDFTITFDENVVVTDTPRLSLTVGSTTRYASYTNGNGSKTLNFIYTPQSGDLDSNGITFARTVIDLNNGDLKNASGNNAFLTFSTVAPILNNINVDAVVPLVTGLNNEDNVTKAKIWIWGCSETPCTYRFIIDTLPLTNPSWGLHSIKYL